MWAHSGKVHFSHKHCCARRWHGKQTQWGNTIHRAISYILLLLIIFSMAACDEQGQVPITPQPTNPSTDVDPIFREFYQSKGGREALGPAISRVEERENNLRCQFTESVLMCFNQAATDTGRFFFYPLGKSFNLRVDDTLEGPLPPEDARVVNGIPIYEKFLPLYDRLNGAFYAGAPLTRLRINSELQRVEQFFENVGFYQKLGDPNGPVFLIPYGAYFCGQDCSYRLNEYWGIVKSDLVEQPFVQAIARLGGTAVFGMPLLHPQQADDGCLEQVYTNVIFCGSPDDARMVKLRPLPRTLGYEEEPLADKQSHDQLVFYEIRDGKGHNVPKPFDAFIALHGGLELAGNPISEVVQVKGQNLFRQCFENYCLIYDPSASESLKVRMLPLGEEYLKRFPPAEQLQIKNVFTPENISLGASPDFSTLASNQEQIVRIAVQQNDTGQPLERVEGTLSLHLPDNTIARYFFHPTDSSGASVVVIPARAGLKHGDRLKFRVCLNLPSERPICQMGSYLIWDVK